MSARQPPSFADLLHQFRVAAGLTQEELAARAGLSLRGISDLERGERLRPRRDTVQLLADALQLAEPDRNTFFLAARGRDQALDDASSSRASVQHDESDRVESGSVGDGQMSGLGRGGLPASAAVSVRDLPQGTVTLLFTSVEGSTRLLQQVGERYAGMLETCRFLLRAQFHQWHGHEVDTQGDTCFVAFARATDAAAAAAAAQRSLFAYPWPRDTPVHVRMGLHTGEPARAADGSSYVGLDVQRAERIMSAASGGQVLLSQTTRDLVEGVLPADTSLRDLGEHGLKDLERPVRLFQLAVAGLPADFPPLKTLNPLSNNLPIQPMPFIGRQHETASICQRLLSQRVRLLTLTGPGGVGKTRLALHAAAETSEHFEDGTWFVSLAPLTDPEQVIPTIIQTLGLQEAGKPSPLAHLEEALREKHALLLLDNFEQVVSASVQVADLLSACPQLKVLVTSREVLHVRAEQEFAVPSLALPDPRHLPDVPALSQYDAVALFIERAQASEPDFQVTNTNAPAVAEICARLDGLPLAIELAASRIKLFSPQSLLVRLGQRLPLLTSSTRDVPARQRTLRSTIQWSYDLLPEAEQQLFRRLAVFVSGCTLRAVESVIAALGDETTTLLDRMASLVDKNLLRPTALEGEESRFLMLETIREFGLERLAASGEREAVRQAHAACYLSLAEAAAPALKGPQHAAWVKRLAYEHDNLRATFQWILDQVQAGRGVEVAVRLGEQLTEFWEVRGFTREALAFWESLVGTSAEAAPALRTRVLRAAAECSSDLGEFERCEALLQESLALYRDLGDHQAITDTLAWLGQIARRTGSHYGAHRAELEERLTLARELGDKQEIARALTYLADSIGFLGEFPRSRVLFEESLALFRELENKREIGLCLRQSVLWLLIEHEPRDLPTIRARLDECLRLYQESGDKEGLAFYFWLAGWAALDQGLLDTGHSLLEESLALWREIGLRWRAVWALTLLGRVATLMGDCAGAHALHMESVTEASAFDDLFLTAFCLDGLAHTAAAQGEFVWATHLWGAAETFRERSGVPRMPIEDVDYENGVSVAHHISAARQHLGEHAFVSAWAEGREMTLAQALAAAP